MVPPDWAAGSDLADKRLTLSKNLVGLRSRLEARRLASRPFANCLIAVTASPLKFSRVRMRPTRGSQKSRSASSGQITTDRMMMSDRLVEPRRGP